MNETANDLPVVLYARVSSDRQDVDPSVAAQLRALRDYAGRNGFCFVNTYIDQAESGRITDRAPFRKMLDEALEIESPVQETQVWKFSRFTRKRGYAVAFKPMQRWHGIRVASITEHADDTPACKLMEAIIESVDEFYSEYLAQEVRRGCARRPRADSTSPPSRPSAAARSTSPRRQAAPQPQIRPP